MPTEIVVSVVMVLVAPATSLMALWLRLKHRDRRDRERRHRLVVVAGLPAGSRFYEQGGDGSQLSLVVGHRSDPVGDKRRI
ncbi:hypothetical protein [Micromonospora sp. HUAS LYJ1]|uniref:hypothetical protein n=1 Tax=Micromonospora sp. HUAS LYJ1 TaxID=3061626 RepID=UPI002673A376|nr:hypothetical protein [Micromonospora sp. HUAS LYJ1]WKU04964.1 hypothetical protein Q2K16_30090 [Micromonospora sp. HUAS LYJ1]